MKNIVLPVLASSVLATSAFAADLPRRSTAVAPAPVLVAAANTWAGFYLGAQVGYGWSKSDGSGFNAAGLAIVNINSKPKGIFGGLHAGYNWQRGALVYGVEVDAEISSVNKNDFATTGFKNDETWRGSARLRMGYAFDPVLLYVTGGLAVRDRQFTVTNGAGAFFNAAENNFGWTLGAGAEFAVNNTGLCAPNTDIRISASRRPAVCRRLLLRSPASN